MVSMERCTFLAHVAAVERARSLPREVVFDDAVEPWVVASDHISGRWAVYAFAFN